MIKKIILFAFLIFGNTSVKAQLLTGIATKWSDAFTEWTIFAEDGDDEIEGEITMRWIMRLDWTEWDYRLGEESGSIRLKFANDPSTWEIKSGSEIITARRKWNNDISEWRISDGSTQFTLKSKYRNQYDEWYINEEKNGIFELFMEWEGDPREWSIVDEFDEDISIHMKVAILFITTYHTSPKG